MNVIEKELEARVYYIGTHTRHDARLGPTLHCSISVKREGAVNTVKHYIIVHNIIYIFITANNIVMRAHDPNTGKKRGFLVGEV